MIDNKITDKSTGISLQSFSNKPKDTELDENQSKYPHKNTYHQEKGIKLLINLNQCKYTRHRISKNEFVRYCNESTSKFRIAKSNTKLQCSILYDYNFI